MTNEQARKILCEYLAFDSEEHSEFLDAIRTLMAQADEVCDNDCEHCAWTECPKMTENDQGHWVSLDECANEGIYCSKCHKKIYTLDFAKKVKCKFCPNCGAKMEEST